MTKGYLLGPNAANYVAARMKEQGSKTGDPAAYSARISGQMMPFEITSEWEKRDEESVYSCRANQIYFDGKTYVKDEEGFEFTLYSPLDLEEEPGYAVGDLVYAIIRGNNWEIVGSPGEGGGLPVNVVIQETLVEGGIVPATKFTTSSTPQILNGFVYAPSLGLHAIPAGTVCLVQKVENDRTTTDQTPYQGQALYQLLYADASSPLWTLMMPSFLQGTLSSNIEDSIEGVQMMTMLPNQTEFTDQGLLVPVPAEWPGIVQAYNKGTTTSTRTYTDSPVLRAIAFESITLIPSKVTAVFTDLDIDEPDYDTHYLLTLTLAEGYEIYELLFEVRRGNGLLNAYLPTQVYTEPVKIPKTWLAATGGQKANLYLRFEKQYGQYRYHSSPYGKSWPDEPQ